MDGIGCSFMRFLSVCLSVWEGNSGALERERCEGYMILSQVRGGEVFNN